MKTKRAIIVGATSGIGYATAKLLASNGWIVGIAGRREDLLLQIQHSHCGIVATQRIDITEDDATAGLMRLIHKLGGMDMYFHSSGIGYQNASLEASKELATVSTNVLGFTRMTDFAFEYFHNHPDTPAYSASKKYINTYLESLAQLCSIRSIKNIHILDIRPGFVKTPFLGDECHYPMQLDADYVARCICKAIEHRKCVITIDWRYRILVFLWHLIPRCIWTKMKIGS